jgi:S-adenosylmethionine synthetase
VSLKKFSSRSSAFGDGRGGNTDVTDTFGTNTIPDEAIVERVRDVFDLSPKGIINHFNLLDMKYLPTARNGHFGNPAFPWERTAEAEKLK